MVSINDVAVSRGVSSSTPEEYERVGLPAVCSCFTCGNIIAHAAAYPAQGFKIKCAEHIGASGFRTVDQFEKYVAVYSLHKKDGGR